jgi:hypothetical protein
MFLFSKILKMNDIQADKKSIEPEIRKEIFIERLRSGQPARMIMKGRCMRPLIDRGDYIIVRPITFSRVMIGDIIIYKKPSEADFNAHRVMRKHKGVEKDFLFAKGDATIYGDAFPTYPEDIYGKVVSIEKRNGRTINLKSRFRCLQGYLLAKRSWVSVTWRKTWESPRLIPAKIIRKFKEFLTDDKK